MWVLKPVLVHVNLAGKLIAQATQDQLIWVFKVMSLHVNLAVKAASTNQTSGPRQTRPVDLGLEASATSC